MSGKALAGAAWRIPYKRRKGTRKGVRDISRPRILAREKASKKSSEKNSKKVLEKVLIEDRHHQHGIVLYR